MAGAYDWSDSAASNTSVGGVNIGENAARSDMNDMGRAIMAGVKTFLLSTGSVMADGAAGDGVTIENTAINAAITRAGVNGHVFFPKGTYKLNAAIKPLQGQTWTFDNARFTHSDDALNMIHLDNVSDVTLQGCAYLTGTRVGAVTDGTSQAGAALRITTCFRIKISGIHVRQFVGVGIKVESTADVATRGNQGLIEHCTAEGCTVGFQNVAGGHAEYWSWMGCNANNNWIGADDSAGNVKRVGGSLSENLYIGYQMTGGANHCHGIIGDLDINHNGDFSIKAFRVTLGQSLSNIHLYDGNLWFDECEGVTIDGGDVAIEAAYNYGSIYTGSISGTTLTVTGTPTGKAISVGAPVYGQDVAPFTFIDALGTGTGGAGTYTVSVSQTVSSRTMRSSGYNHIRNMRFPTPNGLLVVTGDDNDPSRLIFRDCFGPGAITNTGVTINDPADVYVYATRLAGTTQAISGATGLIWPNVPQNGDRRDCFNETTGVFTVPPEMTGQYRVRGHCTFSGTSLDPAASFIVATLVGATFPVTFSPTAFGADLLTFVIDMEVYLNPGDTLALTATISGTSPLFGHPSFDSWLAIEKVA